MAAFGVLRGRRVGSIVLGACNAATAVSRLSDPRLGPLPKDTAPSARRPDDAPAVAHGARPHDGLAATRGPTAAGCDAFIRTGSVPRREWVPLTLSDTASSCAGR